MSTSLKFDALTASFETILLGIASMLPDSSSLPDPCGSLWVPPRCYLSGDRSKTLGSRSLTAGHPEARSRRKIAVCRSLLPLPRGSLQTNSGPKSVSAQNGGNQNHLNTSRINSKPCMNVIPKACNGTPCNLQP